MMLRHEELHFLRSLADKFDDPSMPPVVRPSKVAAWLREQADFAECRRPAFADDPQSRRTRLVNWRGGGIEFGRTESAADPPWWIVAYRGMYWSRDRWHFLWIDYCGPPEVYLTRRTAERRAIAFRQQYGGGTQYEGPLKVEVRKLTP